MMVSRAVLVLPITFIVLFYIAPTSAQHLEKFCAPRVCPPCPTSAPASCQEITQADLPYTISQSGEYCVNSNVTYSGTGTAITIDNVTNVKLHFKAASLTLTQPGAIGVRVVDSEEVTIEGDSIENVAVTPTGVGVKIEQSNFVDLQHLLLINPKLPEFIRQ